MLNEDSTVILYTEEIDKTHTVTVPNLKGMSVDNAKYTLEMSGLNFEIVGAGHSEVSSAYADKSEHSGRRGGYTCNSNRRGIPPSNFRLIGQGEMSNVSK